MTSLCMQLFSCQ